MKEIRGFNLKRSFLLIRNDLFLNRSFFIIFSAVVVSLVVLISTLDAIKSGPPLMFNNNYRILLYIGIFIAGGRIFKGMHSEVKGAAWLTLPASVLEKFVSRLVLLTVLFPLGLMVLFSLISLISGMANSMLFGTSIDFFNPFSRDVLITTLRYLILISIFNLGLIYFKKDALGRTFLSIFIYLLFLGVVVIFGLRVIFGFILLDIGDRVEIFFTLMKNESYQFVWFITRWAIHIAFWYLLAPLCWVIGYIRLKEKEV